jgi:hypothetical protein
VNYDKISECIRRIIKRDSKEANPLIVINGNENFIVSN